MVFKRNGVNKKWGLDRVLSRVTRFRWLLFLMSISHIWLGKPWANENASIKSAKVGRLIINEPHYWACVLIGLGWASYEKYSREKAATWIWSPSIIPYWNSHRNIDGVRIDKQPRLRKRFKYFDIKQVYLIPETSFWRISGKIIVFIIILYLSKQKLSCSQNIQIKKIVSWKNFYW